jgi:hypothetical protein
MALAFSIYPLTINYGIIGVSFAYLIRSAAGVIFWGLGIKKLLRITVRDLYGFVFPILGSCICVFAINCFHPIDSMTNIVSLVAGVFAAITLYSVLGLVIHRFTRYQVFKETIGVLRLLKPESDLEERLS